MVAGNSKPVPSVFGIHRSRIIPTGWNTNPSRTAGLAAFAMAIAGIIESSRGSARVVPSPRKNVRRCKDFLVMNIIPEPSSFETAYSLR
jgi:hypothetical protein